MGHYGLAPVIFESVSQTTLTNSVELGTRVEYDGKAYCYVYNTGNSQALPGHGVTVSGNISGYSVTISSTSMIDAFVGVVHHSTIATAYYGWVVTRGVCKVRATANSGLAAGDLLNAGADGVHVNNSIVTNIVAPQLHGKCTLATASAGVGEAVVGCLFY